MHEMHLKQSGFTYSACGPFTKSKERIETFMRTGNTNYIYKNDLNKVYFQHDMAYGKYKNVTKRTQSYKFLWDKTFEFECKPKYDRYQKGLASVFSSKFFNKISKGIGIKFSNQHFVDELHKLIIEKFRKRKGFL